ncbi:hypothetical protein [Helicobacter brantae]|uniref:hypothetical protein n=1 Tax=Helicobacter brantae TaxID=375927 RepID=UPI0011C01793|nr:hypothetical protein [Helicobacter brantae]
MQTFSKMQRNRIVKKNLGYFLVFIALAIYCFLGDIFVFLPPLLGVMFVLFSHSIVQRKTANLILIFAYLLWIECDRGLALGTLIVFYTLYYILVFNPIEFWIRKKMNFLYVALVYLGFFILLGFVGSYGEGMELGSLAGLFVYYAILEGAISYAFKV